MSELDESLGQLEESMSFIRGLIDDLRGSWDEATAPEMVDEVDPIEIIGPTLA